MTIAEKLLRAKQDFDEVYSKGYEKGKSEGGSDSYYDKFWDSQQNFGNRTKYEYLYAGYGWNDVTFDPKYDIRPTSAEYMFYNSRITDLDAIFKRKGLVFDTSKSTNFADIFYNSTITKVGVIDCSGCPSVGTRFSSMFRTATLQSVERLILISKDFAYNNSMFQNATSLTHIIFEGTIYQSFVINAPTLDLESAKSVLLALKNYAGTDKEYTYKISLSSGTWAVLDADGNSAPGNVTWKDYVYNIGWIY